MDVATELQLVDVSPCTLALLWTCIALLYVVCGAFLALQGAVYLFINKYALFLVANMELLGVGVHGDYFQLIGYVSLTMAALNAHALVTMLFVSLRSRSLRFVGFVSPLENPRVKKSLRFLANALEPMLPAPPSRVRQALRVLRATLVYVWQSFGVTSPNYGVVYILRELVQTALQTYQAYRMSAHVARAWMNHTIVVLLVINCWAMPLIQYVFCRRMSNATTPRLLCLGINVVLDFVSYFVFPLALLWPYLHEYSVKLGNFDQHFWYTDEWLMQWRNEWQLLFVTSLGDGVSKLLVAHSIIRSLRTIPRLLRRRGSGSPVIRGPAMESIAAAAPFNSSSVVPMTTATATTTSPASTIIDKAMNHAASQRWRARIERYGHRVLGLWGAVVLVLHLQTTATRTNTHCLIQVRPWFAPRPVCALMEISCYDGHEAHTGNGSEFDTTIDSIDSSWLSYLVIRHCSIVEITPKIQELSSLMAIKIYNSTLVRWDVDAALTQRHHPNMILLVIVATNMSAVPEGLYHHDFPTKLMDVELSYVNLTAVPDAIADVWPTGMFLVLEGLQLPEFPDVLTKIQPGFLSIANNNFTHIPRSVLENPNLVFLNMNGNPVRALPVRSPEGKYLSALYIVGTLITQLPSWVDVSSLDFELLAGSTPLCEALHVGDASALGVKSLEELAIWQRRVNCTPIEELPYINHYPIVDEEANNPTRVR